MSNRRAWDVASRKYVEESDAIVADRTGAFDLHPAELPLLGPLLAGGPRVVHLQSGHGMDAVGLLRLGARSVVGVDFSAVTVAAASGRVVDADFVVGDALRVPLRGGACDLLYTGKGALMWLADLDRWAAEVARLLVPGGHLFVFDAHPAAPLWSDDADEPRLRGDRGYFGGTRPNDTFPASAIARFAPGEDIVATEWQWTLADVVNAVIGAGLSVVHLGEHAEPFWRPGGSAAAAAWDGRLPNSFTLVARLASPARGDGPA